MSGPLSGVRVVDLTRLVAGDYCTSLLASLGAEVVKIEDTVRGDYIGDYGGTVDGVRVAHELFNRGKRSVSIDLKHPDGQALLQRLAAGADVLVEAFRPGVMARLGLDHQTALARHPKLVWVSISGYGADGPRRHVPGHDLNYLAEAGLLDRLTGTDGRPVPPPIPLADLIGGGLIPALTAVALVLQARATGRGGYVDASIADSMALLPSVLLADVVAGIPVSPRAEQTFLAGALACYDVYRLADGYAAVGALENQFWDKLCQALGHPELVQLQWVESAQPQVRAVVAETFATLTRADVRKLGLEDQACVSVVRSFEEALLTQEAADRGVTVAGPGGVRTPGLPFRIDGKRVRPAVGAPDRGADTIAALRELGLSDDEIARLRAGGVIAENRQSAA